MVQDFFIIEKFGCFLGKMGQVPGCEQIYIKGLVVILGCAHAGVVNTLHYIAKLSGETRIYAVIGGMHLLNASSGRIERTIEEVERYDVQKIGRAHCTGDKAVEKFKSTFPEQCFECSVGTQIEL